jgi:hypothetical protein
MIEWHEIMERTNSPTFCWRSTNKGSFSTDVHGCIFHSLSVWQIVAMNFLQKLPADRSRPLGEPPRIIGVPCTTVWERFSYTMCTGVLFPTANLGRGVTLTTYSHLVPRSRIRRTCTTLPLCDCMTFTGHIYFICTYKWFYNNGGIIMRVGGKW